MKKTLLLCFIHGFKGDDDTFGSKSEFALHLAALIAAELPKVNVRAITYPRYETRGDLFECVGRFRDWLMEKVIDLEVANGSHSPTIDPSVHTILVGHSMGGIVAAETVIALTSERTLRHVDDGDGEELNGLMFPYIQGVLAFDTPYLGISPGVIAHGAEGHYNSATAALTQLGSLTDMLWGSSNNDTSKQAPNNNNNKRPAGALPAPQKKPSSPKGRSSSSDNARGSRNNGGKSSSNSKSNSNNGGSGSGSGGGSGSSNSNSGGGGWGGWGKYAMYAGAAGALAAGGAAAYLGRDHISSGWSWVSSHLEFVGCLGRGEELKARVASMVRLNEDLGVGFANLYTRLGRAAASKQVSMVGTVMGSERTFCVLPSKQPASGIWKEAINDKATDETGAHMAMFEPKDNPGYSKLSEDAKDLVVSWTKNEWYETSGHREIEYIEYPPRQDWSGGGGGGGGGYEYRP